LPARFQQVSWSLLTEKNDQKTANLREMSGVLQSSRRFQALCEREKHRKQHETWRNLHENNIQKEGQTGQLHVIGIFQCYFSSKFDAGLMGFSLRFLMPRQAKKTP
jgi:hypothetical protein